MALKKIMTTFSTNGVEKISDESEIVNDYDELYFDTDTDRILMPDRAGMKEVLSGKINSYNLVGKTLVQNTITLGATGTAPAATTRTVQRIESQTLGDKLKLIYKLGQTSAGRNDGSGDYLLTLPNNIAFNTTYHPVFTGAIWTGGVNNMAQYFIPAYGGIVIDSHWTNQIMVVPYDATRFRLALTNNNSQTTYGFWSSSWYSTSAASGISLQLQFEIWAAEPPAPPMLGARRPPV